MAYEKIVSVPSTATSGQVPQADGVGGFSWGAVDAYTKAQTLTEATKIAYGLDASAVPDDVFNAVKGLLGGGAKIATGSYVGTGTYGESNPCSLTFDFVPKLVIISGIVDTSTWPGSSIQLHTGIWSAAGYNGMQVIQSNSLANNNNATAWSIHASVTNNTFSWHTGPKDGGGSSRHQLNNSGQKYCWVAIG